MSMKVDFPFVTKEITFGNLYDGADGQVKNSILQTSNKIKLNFYGETGNLKELKTKYKNRVAPVF